MTTAIMWTLKVRTPGTIGYLVLKRWGKNNRIDQKVELLVPEQNEAWIGDYTVYSYTSLKDENVLRINYTREDNNYDAWGVWTWGDTIEVSNGHSRCPWILKREIRCLC